MIGEAGPGPKGIGGNISVSLIGDAELPGSRRGFLKAWNPVTQKQAWSVEPPGTWPGGILSTANAVRRTDYRVPRHILTFAIGGKDALSPYEMPELVPPADPGFRPEPALVMKDAMAAEQGNEE